ncbi:N5-carboxyaminoimidazole ribonucleotide synthase [Kingella denitrificans]|uniref:N5-carboxyaminoimidazole ribonucleotide synthase n=1 Tax=Kingella denitrificans ATCC 33394 TaxID=888741 RepID=F0EZA2_9NEIS|nr:5-(carboxyamino)imidazole ribonucleotide synthase [Kingella denitrificans]EGC17359.1 phosphoribosylaminoimidazole carboxylase, ATPase subunit [Kingella denitrificans ATCC 33394]QQB41797.1 5-(carboxyamino)imidazole ribonucleotide synthase [Kingella denitrificans]STR12337.1 N5-carboxyaminoimidazole ribonucleotide synthase [Kingella denitrificans]
MKPILPPAMLGILGGGQLGSMFTVAAKTMGYRVTVLDPDPNAPAARFADCHLCAPFDDAVALKTLAQCAAVTTEFENVHAQSMRDLAQHTRVSPSGDCVAIAQNRIAEKAWIRKAGLPTAPYQTVERIGDIDEGTAQYLPGILKTATLGYDGKGQIRVRTVAEVQAAFEQHGGVACVLEKMVDLRAEISVIVCRLDSRHTATYDPAENRHDNGILSYSTVPARLPETVQRQARQMAVRLADALDYVGVLAVEMFVVGDAQDLVVNEIAPRPHNSGHHTIDACAASQFQQQVRLMCGLPPADTRLLSPCTMANILGDLWGGNGGEPHWEAVQQHPSAHLHLYGKTAARNGRKMGHFTVLADTADQAYAAAQQLHAQLDNTE